MYIPDSALFLGFKLSDFLRNRVSRIFTNPEANDFTCFRSSLRLAISAAFSSLLNPARLRFLTPSLASEVAAGVSCSNVPHVSDALIPGEVRGEELRGLLLGGESVLARGGAALGALGIGWDVVMLMDLGGAGVGSGAAASNAPSGCNLMGIESGGWSDTYPSHLRQR